MKTIKVRIEGLRPILLHNPAAMAKVSTGKKVIPTPQEEAASGCYWMADGSSLMFPGWNVYRAIIKAAGAYKVGKLSAAPILSGAVEIDPFELSFNTKDYDIFTCRAVIGTAGIMRSRPRLNKWALNFTLLVDEQDVNAQAFASLRPIVEEAGRRIGIGDFRLEKKGPFGKFAVTDWTVE